MQLNIGGKNREVTFDLTGDTLNKVTMDGVEYKTTLSSTLLECKVLEALHFSSDKPIGIPEVIKWKLEFNNQTLEWEGFNYTFFPDIPGNYRLTMGKKVIDIKVVGGNKPVYVDSILQLKNALKVENSVIVLTRDISFNEKLVLNGMLISNTKKEKLIYTGPQNVENMIVLEKGARIKNIGIINKGYDKGNRENTASVFYCKGNNVIDGVTADGMRHFCNLENSPENVRITYCRTTNLWDYFVWMSGKNLFIAYNTVDNSRREHCIRGNGYSMVTIVNNNLANLDLRPADADIAKGCIVAQWGEYVYIYGNTCVDGGCGIGPLGREVGKQYPDQRVKFAVARNNTVKNTNLQILHGTEYFRVENNTATVEFMNTEIGYPPERTFKEGIVQGNTKYYNKIKNEINVIVK